MIDLFDSPASPLANCSSGRSERPELLILSGPSGAGKSTWCQGLARWGRDGPFAREDGIIVAGFISPAVILDGQKVGIDLVAQLSGERRRLAVRRPTPMEDGATQTANWQFDAQVLAWANRLLKELPPCDLLILDELGPLEFFHGGGLQTGLELLDSRRAPLAVVVIRPKLLSLAKQRWPWGQTVKVVKGEINCGTSATIVES